MLITKKRLFTELKKSNYYKTILGEEYESYKEKYKNDEDALIFEAAGKLLAQVFINKELGIEQLPPLLLEIYYKKFGII